MQYQYTQLEVTDNFYAVLSTLCDNKIIVYTGNAHSFIKVRGSITVPSTCWKTSLDLAVVDINKNLLYNPVRPAFWEIVGTWHFCVSVRKWNGTKAVKWLSNWQTWAQFHQCSTYSFTLTDPASVKRFWWLNCIFYAFGIYNRKSCA